MMMAGSLHPPFSLFGCAEKRKRAVHGPKEKRRWGENLTCVKFRPKYGGWPEPVPISIAGLLPAASDPVPPKTALPQL